MEPNVFLGYLAKGIVGVLSSLGMSNTPLKTMYTLGV
jgi:hypothetical protein